MLKKIQSLCALLFLLTTSLFCRDVLVEFKGAYFLPTNKCVRKIYNGSALFGPEVTFQLCQDSCWYGFASIDFLIRKGHSLGLCLPTTLFLMPLGFGLKYFVPFHHGDFYVGLGLQPELMQTTNCLSDSIQTTSKWGLGGIAKIGAIFDLCHNLFLDLFFDYSFVKVGCTCPKSVMSTKTNISGAIFGLGIGYRFN